MLAQIFTHLNVKSMQFPSNIMTELSKIKESPLMVNSFYKIYATKKKRNLKNIENLLFCFRVFKEMRNCYMHHRCIADQKLIDAYNVYLPRSNSADLGIKTPPAINRPILGKEVQPDLRGVVGLSDVLIRIMLTIDAELVKSVEAQTYFEDRFKSSKNFGRVLKPDSSVADRQMGRYISALGLSIPENLADIRTHLVSIGCLH